MSKKKTQFYEEMEFDNVQYAVDVVNGYKTKYLKAKKGLKLSIIATLYWFLGMPILGYLLDSVFGEDGFALAIYIGVGIILISYILGESLGSALKWSFKIGTFGWLILPFPFDLVTGLLFMGYALSGLFLFPSILVYMNYRQINKDYQAAKQYLSYYKAKQATTPKQKSPTVNTTTVHSNPQNVQPRTYSTNASPSTRNISSRPSNSQTYRDTPQSYRSSGQSYSNSGQTYRRNTQSYTSSNQAYRNSQSYQSRNQAGRDWR